MWVKEYKGLKDFEITFDNSYKIIFNKIEKTLSINKKKLSLDEDIKNFACLNILLQPFVENAIVHGIAEHSDIKEVNIKITANKLEDDIEFHIIDDGLGVDKDEIEKLLNERPVGGFRGFGINNVNFRLKLCYGEDYGIHYDNVKPHGTDVTIRIKALTINELEEALM